MMYSVHPDYTTCVYFCHKLYVYVLGRTEKKHCQVYLALSVKERRVSLHQLYTRYAAHETFPFVCTFVVTYMSVNVYIRRYTM